MKKEIEVKVRVADFGGLIRRLEELGVTLSEPVEQDDMVFVNYDGDYDRFPEGANYLRIRKTKDGAAFTLKRGSELASIERETKISDPDQMKDALVFMGYHEAVEVRKIRRKAKYKEYEICLDKVEDLGSFVELEKITDEDPETVQAEMIAFLEGLGVQIEGRVVNGYDTLMYYKSKNT